MNLTESIALPPESMIGVQGKRLPEQALEMYSHLNEDHRMALVRANAAIEHILENDKDVHVIDETRGIPDQPGAYLFSEQSAEDSGMNVDHLRFEIFENLLSGKIESAHAVLPGILAYVLRGEDGVVTEGTRQVAIKEYFKRDFEDRRRRIDKEISISKRMRTQGELGFNPVAVVVAPPYLPQDGEANNIFLMTDIEDDVFTLDNSPWHLGPEAESNFDLAIKAVSALARFNKTIGKHGDPKLKNSAQSVNGQVSMIDFETSIELSDDELNKPIVIGDVVEGDLGLFLQSLLGAGFFKRLNEGETGIIATEIIDAYTSHWGDHDGVIQEAVLNAAINACKQNDLVIS